ncbi:glycosyltransferase family 4 protein [Lutibacter flavus]|uniref:Glycosyltransferase involved in cell wall bisynthesis n=1 Tax=Lutibacter flavus TaxID=691689 RepID=A0A238VT24_9FLAO|nr:glycosyltransferase family 4 protein [Lutibacter flavus]SNR36953.1 Glycosyltransferase involved in cell wall bisynthesis [Lutibacter flavus]
MKILLIHNKYGKFSGEEAVVDAQIKLLKTNGHKVITYFRSSEELEVMPNAKIKAFFTAFYNPRSIRDTKDLLVKENPDIVHIHNMYPLISPAILPVIKKMGIPIVMTVHNYRLLCPNGLFFNKGSICEKCTGLGKEINCITNNCEGSIFKSTGYALRNFWARKKEYYLNNVDLFLCLTEFQKKKLVANGFAKENCEVLPNFYNKEIKNLDYNMAERNYVAFAGRISPEKGIPLLLKTAKKLPRIPFQLAGEMRKGYAKELEIPENVIFRGMLNSQNIRDFYSKARLYIHSSVCYEGFPMVFPEAMAHKLPIIAPKMAGYPEIAEENFNGLLFETGNADSLAETIDKLWQNHKLSEKLSSNGFEKVKEKYSSDVYYKTLKKNYDQLLNK